MTPALPAALILALVTLPQGANADVPLPLPRPASNAVLVSVYDGDTARLVLHGDETSTPVRLLGIDAPELRSYGGRRPVPLCETAMADQARDALATMLDGADLIVVPVGWDRYSRLLARLYADGEDVGEALVRMGHAKPWKRGRKAEWC